jgi:hypothetical protein
MRFADGHAVIPRQGSQEGFDGAGYRLGLALFAIFVDQDRAVHGGRRVVFLASDDENQTVHRFMAPPYPEVTGPAKTGPSSQRIDWYENRIAGHDHLLGGIQSVTVAGNRLEI